MGDNQSIDVNENLPESGIEVLCYCECDGCSLDSKYIIASYSEATKKWSDGYHIRSHVVTQWWVLTNFFSDWENANNKTPLVNKWVLCLDSKNPANYSICKFDNTKWIQLASDPNVEVTRWRFLPEIE